MGKLAVLMAAAMVAVVSQSQAAFVAYDDFGGNSTTGTTSITVAGVAIPGTPTGLLKDYATNTDTGVTLTVTTPAGYTAAEGDTGGTNGLMGAVGTDAYNIFGTKIDAKGYAWYNNATTSRARLTFTGCTPGSAYSVTLFGNRANAYLDRYTVSTIAGADSFANTSSTGAAKSTVSILDDTATVMTGENTANGYVAQFSSINPGSDGTFYIDVYGQGSSGNTYKWYLNAISVTETAVPEPTTLSLLGLAVLPLIRRRRD